MKKQENLPVPAGKHKPPKVGKVGSFNRKIDVGLALKLRLHNRLSIPQIAQYFGVSHQAVYKALENVKNIINIDMDLESFEQSRSDLLTAVELQLLNDLVEPTKREKASVNNIAFALSKVFDMNRISQGKSTSIVGYQDLTHQHEVLLGEIVELENQLLTDDQSADMQSAGSAND
jgi:predicted DNA-binding protein YlxM (UPF0122 family)